MRQTDSSHTWPRLYIEQPLIKEDQIALNQEQSHYLVNVMRASEGSKIRLFNGQDGEWIATLSEMPKKRRGSAIITLESQRRPQSPVPDLTLCAAPIKRAHFDFMIMKATELGVKTIQPILTERTQVRDVKLDRLRSIAIEASEQSERLCIPAIHAPILLPKLLEAWDEETLPILCAEFGDAKPVQEAFEGEIAKKSQKTAIFVGPEGGFTEKEMNLFLNLLQHLPIRLGKRILRADTAAIAALSCWQSICGDWKES